MLRGVNGPSGWAAPIIKIAKEKFGMTSVVLIAPNDQGGTDIASVDADAAVSSSSLVNMQRSVDDVRAVPNRLF